MVPSVRDVDVCARVGGDEFMIVLPGARSDDAEEAVRRLRDAVAASTVGDTASPLTLSAGVAEYPDHAADQDELVRLADGAMYWSKRAGRDGCSRHRSDADQALSPAEDAAKAKAISILDTVHGLALAVGAK